MAAFYSPNGSLTVNNDASAVGRNAIAAVAQSFMAAFPDLQIVMDNVATKGDHAEYHWTLIGTNAGPGGTGHWVHISGFECWHIGGDGLIAQSQGHFDSAEYQRQLEHGAEDIYPDSPLTPQQEALVRLLTAADLQRIDECLLSHTSDRWRKVARVVASTMASLAGHFPDVPDVFYSRRIKHLVASGALEAVGNLDRMRFSEVRIATSKTSEQDLKQE